MAYVHKLTNNIPQTQTIMLPTTHSSSKSIPIPLPENNDRHNRCAQLDIKHASKVAEWQESQMYQRLLNGMFLSCQRLDYHPKVIASLENLMQIQALPVSSLEAPNATSEEQNETWFKCSSCSSEGNGDMIETKGPRIASPDCFCSSIRSCTWPRSSLDSLSSWNCALKMSSSSLAKVGAAPDALQQRSKLSGDEEEDDLMFDFEI